MLTCRKISYALLAFLAPCAHSATSFTCAGTATDNDSRMVETTLAGVPAILRIPPSISKPPVVLWHGFGPPASERALMDALPLDEVPAVKVYLGLPLFGARAPVGGTTELARRQSTDFASLLFEPSVMGAANELRAVMKALEEHRCLVAGEPIGLFGFSAGGAAVLFALAEHKVPVSVAVTLNASTGLNASIGAFERATKQPFQWTPRSRELAQRSDAPGRAKDIATGNPPPALLIMHGYDDAMLTPQVATSLHQVLQPLYRQAGAEQRLQLMLVPDLAHAWADNKQLDELRRAIGTWFDRYLGQPAA